MMQHIYRIFQLTELIRMRRRTLVLKIHHFKLLLILKEKTKDDVLVLFCRCVDNDSSSRQIYMIFLRISKPLIIIKVQLKCRIVRKHFSRQMAWGNLEMVVERRSYVFRCRSNVPVEFQYLKDAEDRCKMNLQMGRNKL